MKMDLKKIQCAFWCDLKWVRRESSGVLLCFVKGGSGEFLDLPSYFQHFNEDTLSCS